MECRVRPAHEGDASEMSQVIQSALRETNAKDYPPDIIERLEKSFSTSAVLGFIGKRKTFVAVLGCRVVGTANLDGAAVRTVFVAPDAQGRGVGRMLVAEVERAARQMGVEVLTVPSSITAEHFYSRLGFKAVRDSYHGEERTIIMERSLVPL